MGLSKKIDNNRFEKINFEKYFFCSSYFRGIIVILLLSKLWLINVILYYFVLFFGFGF